MSDQPLDYLAATDELISLFDELPPGEFFGADLMRNSMIIQRDRLLSRRFSLVEAHEEVIDLEIRQPNQAAGAEASLLSTVLAELQEAVLAIAQSLRERPTLRGPVTADIRAAVGLNVAFALPGSLRLRLVPAEPVLQSLLPLGDGERSLLGESVETFLNVLDTASSGEEERLLEQLAAVGPRASGHLASLSSALSRGSANMGVGWRSRQSRRSLTFSRSDAQRLSVLLHGMETSERTHVHQGRLVGGSLVRRTFELELDDGTVISGRADEDVLPMLEELFGQDCTAQVLVTETRLASSETKEAYRLQRLDP